MPGDRRAGVLAQRAADLAAAAGVTLPDDLRLWHLAQALPRASRRLADFDPGPKTAMSTTGEQLGAALEELLSTGERRAGAHYTPPEVSRRVAAMALGGPGAGARRVVDMSCGGGALLLAAGDALVAAGAHRADVARELLWGADIDPLAVAVTEAAIALWSGGTRPAEGHLVVADTLSSGRDAWALAPPAGFDALVGNPPFQGQLDSVTARSRSVATALKARFGGAATGYVDTAALFLLAATELVRPGGGLAMVVPQSVIGARDAARARAAVDERATLRDMWAPDRHVFAAKVHVCVLALQMRDEPATGSARLDGGDGSWTKELARSKGAPVVELTGGQHIADLATAAAGFRDEYYGLVGHVREAAEGAVPAPLVTSGSIGVATCTWGQRPIRFAKRSWARPEVDLPALAAANQRTSAWVERLRRPKVVVATQTRVLEAAADHSGSWVAATPVVSVLPHDPADVARLTAVLCAPPVSAWALGRAAGTAMAPDAIRVSTALVLAVPLPLDAAAWDAASAALAAGDLGAYAELATAMYALPPEEAAAVVSWWHARRPRSGANGVANA